MLLEQGHSEPEVGAVFFEVAVGEGVCLRLRRSSDVLLLLSLLGSLRASEAHVDDEVQRGQGDDNHLEECTARVFYVRKAVSTVSLTVEQIDQTYRGGALEHACPQSSVRQRTNSDGRFHAGLTECGRVDPQRTQGRNGQDDAERKNEHAFRHRHAFVCRYGDVSHHRGKQPVQGEENHDEELA